MYHNPPTKQLIKRIRQEQGKTQSYSNSPKKLSAIAKIQKNAIAEAVDSNI